MFEYPKTENLFARDPETHKLIVGSYRRPDFAQVNRWLVTEKIDGTNIRLCLDWERDAGGVNEPFFSVRGRSDAATLPGRFIEEAIPRIDVRGMVEALHVIQGGFGRETGDDADPRFMENPPSMVIFGEGYGPGIQKGGGAYAEKKQLRIFDVVTIRDSGRLWRTWSDVEDAALVLGLETAPVLADATGTDRVLAYVQKGPHSETARLARPGGELPIAEGVIARTDPYLFDWRGNRVVFKLKGHDLS